MADHQMIAWPLMAGERTLPIMAAALGRTATEGLDVSADLESELARACRRLASGDSEALEQIYRLLGRELYAFALWSCSHSQDAEDLVQDTFVRLAASSESLGSVRRPRAFIFKVLHRLCIDHARKRRGFEELDELLLVPVHPRQESRAEAARLSRKLRELSAAQRQCLLLREVLGMSYREIADATGTNLFTAASRHRLALSRVRRTLGGRR